MSRRLGEWYPGHLFCLFCLQSNLVIQCTIKLAVTMKIWTLSLKTVFLPAVVSVFLPALMYVISGIIWVAGNQTRLEACDKGRRP